jgi:arginase
MRAALRVESPPNIPTVAVASGAGALDSGCFHGPAAFQRYWYRNRCDRFAQLDWNSTPYDLHAGWFRPIDLVARTAGWLAGITHHLAEIDCRFLVIGGDHSCAIGTWAGVATTMEHSGPFGLIWIDAHMDMHVPETSHSGAINGMPVAVLLGHGAPELTGLTNSRDVIDARHICLLGARSFESEEIAFAKRLGVRVIDMTEISKRGLEDAFAEARAIAVDNTAEFGISLDLDAFDPAEAPGVGTPAPGGIHPSEFVDEWAVLTRHPHCRGIEIVEYNPLHDKADRTARLMSSLVTAAVAEDKLLWAS